MMGTWPSAPSCGSDLVTERITRSVLMKMPRFLTDVTGETWTPSIDNAVDGSWKLMLPSTCCTPEDLSFSFV